jgi:hypothetical protein
MMNVILPRFLKVAYRKEPLTGFMVLVGVVDVTLGGVGHYGSLTFLGLATVGTGLALRWWQIQRSRTVQPERVAHYALPPHSSNRQLPALSTIKRQAPH